MQIESCRQELVEALQLLRQRRFEEIDVGRMLETAEWCHRQGGLLYCLVFLKIARCAHRLGAPIERLRSANSVHPTSSAG
jgi:hypothetical protein